MTEPQLPHSRQRISTRVTVAGITAAAALAAGATALAVTSHHAERLWLTVGLAIPAGLSFIISGFIALHRRPENRTGLYLLAVGYFWFLGALPSANDPWVFTVGLLVQSLPLVFFTALLLAYPDGTLRTPFARWLPVATAVVIVVFVGATLLVEPNPVHGCENCPRNTFLVADNHALQTIVQVLGSLVVIGIVTVLLVVLAQRWRRAGASRRRALTAVYVTAGASIVVIAVSNVVEPMTTLGADVLSAAFVVLFTSVPLAFLAGVLRTRLARASVGALLRELEHGAPLDEALAEALGDPTLGVVYHLPDGRWTNAEGQEVPMPQPSATRAVTPVTRDEVVIGALEHDLQLMDSPGLVAEVAATAGIWMQKDRLQTELRAQYAMLEAIVDTAPSLLLTLDTEGLIVNYNGAVEHAVGVERPDELRGALFWDVLIDPVERDAVIERFWAAAPGHPAARHENAFTNRRGEHRVIQWESAPIHAPGSSEVVGIVAGGVDITERKLQELELKRERDVTEVILEAMPSIIVVLTADGEIVDRDADDTEHAGINRAFRELFGWDELLLVRRPFTDVFIHPDDAEAAAATVASAVDHGQSAERESRWLTARGDERVISWKATRVPDVTARRPFLVLVTGADVTDRRMQEREIRASRARIVQAADTARRLLERDLHDGAQQRLVSLSLSLRLLERRLADPEQAAELLLQARDELAQALDELRELARGIHPAVLTDRGLAAAIETLASRSPVPVSARVVPDRLPPAIEAALYYTIAEALTNVAKYAHASSVTVTVDSGDGRIVAEVADDGVGGADPRTGSGLRGLEDRLAALDGHIAIASRLGGGTVVRAELPLAASEDGSTVRPAAPNVSRQHPGGPPLNETTWSHDDDRGKGRHHVGNTDQTSATRRLADP